jgi:hypothetical protein
MNVFKGKEQPILWRCRRCELLVKINCPAPQHCHGNRQSEKGRARSSMWNMSIVKLNKLVCFSHSALLPEMRVCACVRVFVLLSTVWSGRLSCCIQKRSQTSEIQNDPCLALLCECVAAGTVVRIEEQTTRSLASDQLDAQIFNTFITVLYMYTFRAISCSSSGGQIVLIQHLVSPLSVSERPVHWLRKNAVLSQPVHRTVTYWEWRYQMLD